MFLLWVPVLKGALGPVGVREDFDLFAHSTPSSKDPGAANTSLHFHETHFVLLSILQLATADE